MLSESLLGFSDLLSDRLILPNMLEDQAEEEEEEWDLISQYCSSNVKNVSDALEEGQKVEKGSFLSREVKTEMLQSILRQLSE